jgi:phosphoribosylanthranilate isomerase
MKVGQVNDDEAAEVAAEIDILILHEKGSRAEGAKIAQVNGGAEVAVLKKCCIKDKSSNEYENQIVLFVTCILLDSYNYVPSSCSNDFFDLALFKKHLNSS